MSEKNKFYTPEDDARDKALLQKNYNRELRKMELAEDLLNLLAEYLDVADKWEDYDEADHTMIQTDYMIPLMERVSAAGWAYNDLTDIIPGWPKTSKKQRRDTFRSLRMWAEDKYGIIPF